MRIRGRSRHFALMVLALVLGGCLAAPATSPVPSGEPVPSLSAVSVTPTVPASSVPSTSTGQGSPARPSAEPVSPSPMPSVAQPTVTATQRTTPPPSPLLTSTATLPPAPTPGPDEWIGPDLISARDYAAPSMVIDRRGFAHVAAQLGPDIYYVTNSSGSWTRERLTRAPRRDRHVAPLIALGDEGTLGIAYTSKCRACAPDFPEGSYFMTDSGGRWSDPVRVSDGRAKALRIDGGNIHLIYEDVDVEHWEGLEDLSRPLYTTNENGSWTAVELAPIGEGLALELSPDGRVHVLLLTWDAGQSDRATLRYAMAAGPGEPFGIEEVPVPAAPYYDTPSVALDRQGRPHIVSGTSSESLYTRMRRGRWASETIPGPTPASMLIDADGALHAISLFWTDEKAELLYWTDAGKSYTPRSLGCCRSAGEDGDWSPAMAMALDGDGRLHLFYGTDDGTWYAVAPRSR
jgi:hypothetical protein